jgi:hypothetical protein
MPLEIAGKRITAHNSHKRWTDMLMLEADRKSSDVLLIYCLNHKHILRLN